ncbi:MAG TPA: hypothetical protein PLP27_02810 [Crocinitomicaceae bacterium]|nr:hypothetical protein [Crocinitomicaceae bacterium]
MKNIVTIMTIVLLVGCENSKKFEYEGKEYWSEYRAGNKTTLQQEYKVFSQGLDTIIHFTNYYQNGKLKSKVVMKNNLLMEIELVLDTLGNKMNFGNFKNGNGYVIEYSSDDSSPENEGRYVKGNKQGWWKNYHFTGTIIDSTFYKDGFPQFEKSDNVLTEVLDSFGPFKNNLYK